VRGAVFGPQVGFQLHEAAVAEVAVDLADEQLAAQLASHLEGVPFEELGREDATLGALYAWIRRRIARSHALRACIRRRIAS
jgi:hypothetical protein